MPGWNIVISPNSKAARPRSATRGQFRTSTSPTTTISSASTAMTASFSTGAAQIGQLGLQAFQPLQQVDDHGRARQVDAELEPQLQHALQAPRGGGGELRPAGRYRLDE